MPGVEFRPRQLGYILWFVGFIILVIVMNRVHSSVESLLATRLTIETRLRVLPRRGYSYAVSQTVEAVV
jgi:hypothetical protein